jgi:hypothetical protein
MSATSITSGHPNFHLGGICDWGTCGHAYVIFQAGPLHFLQRDGGLSILSPFWTWRCEYFPNGGYVPDEALSPG